jgi:hypothetical protein
MPSSSARASLPRNWPLFSVNSSGTMPGSRRCCEWKPSYGTRSTLCRRQTPGRANARTREFRSLRLPFTRFVVEIMELESQDAAREAVLCVRNDGLPMSEVASEGRYPYRCVEVLLEDVPEDSQQKFISVRPGSLLDPIPQGDGFQLWRVLEKHDPNPEDPAVRERIDQRIIDRHFSELCAKHIRWRFVAE